ncbi:MAG: hypothetical protein GC150_00180 [Rhizobiales bacterium]|nr:hypothetical protein [Hyphomicrobiales bacterium]
MRLIITLIAGLVLIAGAPSANAQSGAQFIEKFNDWSVFSHDGPNGKLCFAVSQPKDFEPKNAERGEVYFYVSSWPKDGVTNEISVKIGYDFSRDATTVITIGSDNFELFNNGDKAFVESAATERRLVDAMRRGSRMVVKGTSDRGTATTDTYSLSGITAALNHVAKVCE